MSTGVVQWPAPTRRYRCADLRASLESRPISTQRCSGCDVVLTGDSVRYEQHVVRRRGVEPRLIRRLCADCVADARRDAEHHAPPDASAYHRRFHARLVDSFGA